jgi:hypothetical protein
MATALAIVTNIPVRGLLPWTICLVFLALMWIDAVFGFCLGCEIHGLMVRRGRAAKDPDFEVCAHRACEVPVRAPQAASLSATKQ